MGCSERLSSEAEQLLLVQVAHRLDLGDAEPALGEGPGLVEDHGVQVPAPLERGAVPDQEPAASDVETATTSGTARVAPALRAMMVSHRAARLARSWVRERDSWAS